MNKKIIDKGKIIVLIDLSTAKICFEMVQNTNSVCQLENFDSGLRLKPQHLLSSGKSWKTR